MTVPSSKVVNPVDPADKEDKNVLRPRPDDVGVTEIERRAALLELAELVDDYWYWGDPSTDFKFGRQPRVLITAESIWDWRYAGGVAVNDRLGNLERTRRRPTLSEQEALQRTRLKETATNWGRGGGPPGGSFGPPSTGSVVHRAKLNPPQTTGSSRKLVAEHKD